MDNLIFAIFVNQNGLLTEHLRNMKLPRTQRLIAIFIFLFTFPIYGQKNISDTIVCKQLNEAWLEHTLDLTKNCVGFSAPVAARALSYYSLGMYEVSTEYYKDKLSMSSQIPDFSREKWNKDDINIKLLALEVNYSLTIFLYANMPPENLKKTDALYQLWKSKIGRVKKKIRLNTLELAEQISNAIISYSKTDGGFEGYKRNFPQEFKIVQCDSCWVKTPAAFQSALLPYWGSNRHHIESNSQVCNDIPYLYFSSDTNSAFYQENKRISDMYQDLQHEQEVIAEYWDDSPGVSGSPVGHFFNIGKDLSKDVNQPWSNACEMYLLMGFAINDAVIESWTLKYFYNLIRPITYIQRYIDPTFNPAINTPPFPEFPSGHSFQSGAGSEILKAYFSDTLAFTDYTNELRKDIDGTPRHYANFTEMSEEMSLSRYYGGIHYDNTLRVSLQYGRKIGQNTLKSIRFK